MSYSTAERNNAILDIAGGHPDLKNVTFYESLASFDWITITWSDKIIKSVALTYWGEQLSRKLLKNK